MNKELLILAKNNNNKRKNKKKKKPRNKENICLIEKFPKKLIEYILSFSNIRTVGRFSRSSKTCNKICESNVLWKKLALKHNKVDADDDQLIESVRDWKQFCKDTDFKWKRPTCDPEMYNMLNKYKGIEIKEPTNKKGSQKIFLKKNKFKY